MKKIVLSVLRPVFSVIIWLCMVVIKLFAASYAKRRLRMKPQRAK